ncbi:MAG: hypothetical protein QF357_07465, partial [Dehalococcoidia bacterium]|nr:hypothetical protein [Dehalococcoidia bacterium]
MIVGLMVGAPFATAIAAGIPQYGRSLEIVSMRAAVEDVGPINTNVHVTTSWTPLTAKDHLRTDEAVFSASDTHFGELVTGSVRLAKSRLNWWGWLGGPMRTDELASQSRFQYIERIDNHVGYVTGQAPTEATTIVDGVPVIEVAVYHERAELLQIKIGDVIDSQPIERGAGLVRALVTGTFQRNDPDEVFWMGFGDIFLAPAVDGREQPLIMFPTYDSMFTAVAEANAGLPGTFDWFLFTDPVFMGNMTMAELETALDNL